MIAVQRQMPRERESHLALSHPLKIAQNTAALGIASNGRIELATCCAKVGIASSVDMAVGSARYWPALPMPS